MYPKLYTGHLVQTQLKHLISLFSLDKDLIIYEE